jgi:hypothetical protein
MSLPRLLALALAVACADAPTAPRVTAGTRILFIGNSLTYVHDVPSLVTAIARQVGDDDLGTGTIAFPDFSLEDHWYEGSAATSLARQEWEYVVMQQGPSSLPESQRHLESWSLRLAPAIRASGAVPVLYAVWPHIQRRADAPNVLVSYRNAARAVSGRLAPAGAAWDSVLASGDQLPLYSSDGLHASPYGAWLAAVVIYATVRGIDPATLPTTLPAQVAAPPLAAERVRALLRLASAAMAAADQAAAAR